jgi:hypothetical protein
VEQIIQGTTKILLVDSMLLSIIVEDAIGAPTKVQIVILATQDEEGNP